MIITFILSCFVFFEVTLLGGSPCEILLFSWINSEILNVEWGFLFDTLTAVMLIVVNSISTLVHIYSTGYMSEDPHLSRFKFHQWISMKN